MVEIEVDLFWGGDVVKEEKVRIYDDDLMMFVVSSYYYILDGIFMI